MSESQLDSLLGHYLLLERWNRVLNLTSIRNFREAVVRHYAESLFLEQVLPKEAVSVVDVGSGAGFPGVPLAVMRPACRVTLVESNRRKAVFLREATRALHNVEVLAERAESVQGKYEWLVSRAVACEMLLSLCPRLSGNLGMLVSAADLGRWMADSAMTWEDPRPIPWARGQCVLLGRHVSRGT